MSEHTSPVIDTIDAAITNVRNEINDLTKVRDRLLSLSGDEAPTSTPPLKLTPTTRKESNRGRPKGSKNRPSDVIAAEKAQREADRKARGITGPGRPKGSKNKSKVMAVSSEQPEEEMIMTSPVQNSPIASVVPDTPSEEYRVVDVQPDEPMVVSESETVAAAAENHWDY